ncbi:MAG: hypothetical protein HZA37_02140 [Parcubacteria group bacterium]|nr:hypothetical protein [Parcubacteria group bacterium]
MSRLKKISRFVNSLFVKDGDFLVVEIFGDCSKATVLRADFADKSVNVLKCRFFETKEKDVFGALKKITKGLSGYKTILALDSDFAYTVNSSIGIIRDNPKETITESDLDNILFQALWRFFDRYRAAAAERLGVGDVDVVLSDIRVGEIKLDGHKVINPVGFKAKSAEIDLSETFISRKLFDFLKINFFGEKNAFVRVTELGSAWAHLLSRKSGKESSAVALLASARAVLFSSASGRAFYLDEFKWGGENLRSAFSGYLKIPAEAAEAVIGRYIARDASEKFLRHFQKVFLEEFEMFLKGLKSVFSSAKSAAPEVVHLGSFCELPAVVFDKKFDFKIAPLSPEAISEMFGFRVKMKKSAEAAFEKRAFSTLAVFLEAHFNGKEGNLNRLISRRAKWLTG